MPAVRAAQVGAEAPLHRPDLELALVHVLEVLRRAEDRVDERADEREDERGRDGDRDEDRIGDAPPRVLVRPEHEREPEDDEEEQRQPLIAVHVPGVEEVLDPREGLLEGCAARTIAVIVS